VVQAARRFSAERGFPLFINAEKYVLYKDREPSLPGCVPANDFYFDLQIGEYCLLPADCR
jgi:hypothetical protein